MEWKIILQLIQDYGALSIAVFFLIYVLIENYLPDYLKFHWAKVISEIKKELDFAGKKEYEIFRQSVDKQREFINWINGLDQYEKPLQDYEKLKINKEYQEFLTKLPDPILESLHYQLKTSDGFINDKKPIWIAMRKVCFPNTQLKETDLYEWR